MTTFSFRWRNALKSLLFCGVLAFQSGCRAQNADLSSTVKTTGGDFELRDQIGRSWQNEVVTFNASPEILKSVTQKRILSDAKGQATPYQLIPATKNTPVKIAFTANIEPYGSNTYRFGAVAPLPATDVRVEETGREIRLTNKHTGIALRKTLTGGNAPIESIRLASGRWVGDSRLQGARQPVSYHAQITAHGPVFAEVLCEAEFDGGKQWRLRARLIADEPVVLVSEEYSLQDGSAWTLDLSENFAPEYLLHRFGRSSATGRVGALNAWKIEDDAEPAFVLEPWLRWWMRDRQGNWFGVYNQNSTDLLALGALRPAQWLDPAKNNRENVTVPVTRQDGKLQADFVLKDGVRHWMIAALDKAQSTVALENGDKIALKAAPLPQQYLIKYGDFPLDMVKDYVLDWKSADSHYPRLLLTKTELANLRQNFKPDEKQLESYLKLALAYGNIDGPLKYYLASGNPDLGRRLADFVLEQIQVFSDSYLVQGPQVTLGFAPHHNRTIQTVINVADGIWETALTEAERTRLKAQMAFLGYTFARDDYWSPRRGYSANPNMTSMVAGYQAQIGMMLLSHPRADEWADKGLTELKYELDEWSDAEGGWLEAPAYAMASYDFLLGMFLAAHNTGHGDYLYQPRMKKIADWFANISTPPDSRIGGIRHLPPIGNTYIGQPTGEFGILAYLWKEKDPEFAARMQWMYRQHGNFPQAGIGGFEPSLAGYRAILTDNTLPAKKPDYASTLFPQTGVLLRNGVDDRETQLHLISGDNHAHYDKDSGSVTLWGKGRIVADDFGYQGYMPGDDHSMIVSPIAADISVMHVQEFMPSEHFDYVRGRKTGWQRQIAFVKESDPLAPNYFVLSDTLAVPSPATWRLWLTADSVLVRPQGALARGKEDVDTDIVFVTPDNVSLATEEKTRATYGLDAKRKYGRVVTTQTGLIANVTRGERITAVVYPRLKTEPAPRVTALAGGKAVKVEHQAGTDYIFLGDKPFTYQGEGIIFEGESGLVRIRGGKATLSLGAAGRLNAFGQSISKAEDKTAAKRADNNLISNGNFETGEQSLFPASPANGALEVALHEGNPAPANEHTGQYSLALSLKSDGRSAVSLKEPPFIDRSRVYRISAKVYTPNAIHFMLTGYASSGKDFDLKDEKGKVWGYSADVKGPLPGWQTVSTTIGPPGSNARYKLPPDALRISMTLRLSGAQGTVYVDDFAVEETE